MSIAFGIIPINNKTGMVHASTITLIEGRLEAPSSESRSFPGDFVSYYE